MPKFIRFSSVSKEFFDLLDKTKRQKKAVSVTKLIVVSAICFLVIGLYAVWVNQASTRGYFLKQETKKYDALVFQRSIVQLDNLQLEKQLYDSVFKGRKSRYDEKQRRTVVTIGMPEEAKREEIPDGAIEIPAIDAFDNGLVTIFEDEETAPSQ